MRDWIIKHWLFNYDSVVFGWKPGFHLRVVNTIIVLFCAAGLLNLFTEGLTVVDVIALLIPLAVFIWRELFLKNIYTYEDLDWEQKYQYLRKQSNKNLQEFYKLEARFNEKYHSGKKFVEAKRIIFPFTVIVLTVIIYAIFGSAEAGFPEMRGF